MEPRALRQSNNQCFSGLVSWGLSDQLLYSIFNALHLQTIIASIEGASGWTLVQRPILFD
jgi:hypothetical protein